MFLLLLPKFRKFMAAHPVVAGLLIVIVLAALMGVIDLWRMRKQPQQA